MEQKNKIINKFSIKICTAILYVIAILYFEIAYCNSVAVSNFINGESIHYNVSFCRIVMYTLFAIIFALLSFSKRDFWKEIEDTNKNKFKRILIYLCLICEIITIIVATLVIIKKPQLSRGISIGIITTLMISIFIINVSKNIAKNVIVITFSLGIVYSITTSFNHAIDEKKHFMTAFNISFLNFDYEKNPITDKKVEELPQLSKFTTIDKFLEGKYVPEITSEVNMEDTPSTPTNYKAILYIFPAIGITIARVLGGSIIDIYIMGRIFNLILYAILIYIAIKIIPYKKNILFVLAMMPYMLLLAGSYSIDGYCIGTAFIFIAYCLKLKKEAETISLKQFIVLAILYGFLLIAKNMAYLFTGLIVLMLPIRKTLQKNKRYLPIIITITVLCIILIGALLLMAKSSNIVTDDRTTGNDAQSQMNYMLTHPLHDIRLAFEQIKNTLFSFDWICMLHYNIFFTQNAKYVMLPLLLFILYVSLTEDDFNFENKNKIIMIISFLLVLGMTSAALYLCFTEVGALYVAGYQTRYIVPILPLLLFTISNNSIKVQKKESRNQNIAIMQAAFIAIGLLQLILV